MKDRIPTKPGRVAVYDEDGKFLRYEIHVRADEPTQEGDPLNKANLLSDATATKFGRGNEPDTVNEAISKILDFGNITLQTEVITQSKTYTVPSHIGNLQVRVFGGGGGISSNYSSISGGGGGGHMAFKSLNIPPNNTVSITIGSSGATDHNGGTTSFGSYVSANGGHHANSEDGGDGGTGGGGGSYMEGLTYSRYGGSGGDASYGGGGGGGSFQGGNGGTGGTYGGGGGGAGGYSSHNNYGGTGGTHGGNGGAYVNDVTSPAEDGTNTTHLDLEFTGLGKAGTFTQRGGGAGGGGYGGNGGNGGFRTSNGGGGGGGGYGGNGGDGFDGNTNQFPGGGGGGGYGGKGSDGMDDYGGGGGGYGANNYGAGAYHSTSAKAGCCIIQYLKFTI